MYIDLTIHQLLLCYISMSVTHLNNSGNHSTNLSIDLPQTLVHLDLRLVNIAPIVWVSLSSDDLTNSSLPCFISVSYVGCLDPRALWNSYNGKGKNHLKLFIMHIFLHCCTRVSKISVNEIRSLEKRDPSGTDCLCKYRVNCTQHKWCSKQLMFKHEKYFAN